MKLIVCSVFDTGTQAFIPPFFVQSDEVAIRSFEYCSNDPSHDFCRYSNDYTLFKLGTFDDSLAKFDMLLTPMSLGSAYHFKKSEFLPLDTDKETA